MSQAFLDAALQVFSRTRHKPTDSDIADLARNMATLQERGLTKLNDRLINCGKKIWDTLSEQNFASMLLARHGHNTPIAYEPSNEGLKRPPDFKLVIESITFWIQMKRLSDLERENRQNKIIDKIKKELKKETIGLFWSCDLMDGITENNSSDLTAFIAEQARHCEEQKEYFFPNDKNPLAKVVFWAPVKNKLSSLTLGFYGDFDAVDETGLARNQIKESLINAAGAFNWPIEQRTINLIAMDADRHEDIDLGEALFGTEFDQFNAEKHTWGRQTDGFFNMPGMDMKIAGVIAARRKTRKPVSEYSLLLFINENFKGRLNDIHKLLRFDKVIYYNMRPQNGNFPLA